MPHDPWVAGRAAIVESADDKAVNELFEDCLANTIADLPKTSQLAEATTGYSRLTCSPIFATYLWNNIKYNRDLAQK